LSSILPRDSFGNIVTARDAKMIFKRDICPGHDASPPHYVDQETVVDHTTRLPFQIRVF
jgi:hypothetical protein